MCLFLVIENSVSLEAWCVLHTGPTLVGVDRLGQVILDSAWTRGVWKVDSASSHGNREAVEETET